MKPNHKSVLITGGGSGIGLSEVFYGLGNQVIIAGAMAALGVDALRGVGTRRHPRPNALTMSTARNG